MLISAFLALGEVKQLCMHLLSKLASQVALVINNPPANAGDMTEVGLIPGLGRYPGEGHGNPLQYSWLENPVDRGAWWAIVHRVMKSQTQLKWLSTKCSYANFLLFVCLKYSILNFSFMQQLSVTLFPSATIWFRIHCCCVSVDKLCLTICEPIDCCLPWDFLDKNTGVNCHFHLQGLFSTQVLNQYLLHWQEDSLPLSDQGSHDVSE